MSLLIKIIVQLIYATLFAICESIFYYITKGYFRTTIEQFVLTFFLSPFIIQIDRTLSSHGYNILWIVFIYPILVWIFEIVGGFTLLYYFGNNNAWTYTTSDALFCGMIRLHYFLIFSLLGLMAHYTDVYFFR